jgi:signal transduction histidine kinase
VFVIPAAGGDIVSSGKPLPSSVRGALAEAHASIRAGTLHVSCPLLRVDRAPDARDPHVLVWRVPETARSAMDPIVGFVADLSFISGIFERILADTPLLPPSLHGDPRRFLSVRVESVNGIPLFESSTPWSPYESSSVLQSELGSLRLSVALAPDAADTLVIGGLPSSQLPMLAGLTLLTAALILIAIVQVRREYELGRLRADFISGVSHELRTPLAQIRLFGETLLLGRVRSAGEERRSLAIIVQESQRLTRLIENVLHFSRAERGAPSLSPAFRRLDDLLDEILDAFAPLAASRGVTFARHLDEVIVSVDAEAFRQVMLNLLDNAVKYGPPGQMVTVTLRLVNDVARVAVEDQGPGVAAGDIDHIWAPFYRGAAHTDVSGGTGIGLTIVRQLVKLHGGQAAVERGLSGGARFVVDLPGATRAALATEAPNAAVEV